ncbi:MAG: glycosyltransferase family 2 protein [Flavobacteriaceae bacterium]
MKSTAVVLLNFNGLQLVQTFLPKVFEYSPEAHIALIDNQSTDGSLEWVKENYPSIQCIELEKNLGYAGGYNEGLKKIKATYYCLLNTDILVTENWLTPLINHFENHPETAVLQPHILDQKKPSHFEYAGAAGGYIDANGIPFCRGRILNRCEADQGQYNITKQIFWASGACFLIRSDVFWKIEGFDDRFFAHQEEIDLCWRLFNKNLTVESIGASKVYHVGGATLSPSPQKVFLNHRNSLYMMTKNLPENQLYSTLFKRMCWDGLIGIAYLFQFKFLSTWAIIRAHKAFYLNFKFLKSRRDESTKRDDYFYVKNIFWVYFVKRCLFFSDLKNK